MTGRYDAIHERDCSKGLEPRIRHLPLKLVLATDDRGDYIAKYLVMRDDDYRDDAFERLLELSEKGDLPGDMETMRRLGAFKRGMWMAYSKIDDGYIGTEKTAKRLIARGIAPQKGLRHDVCCIGFCEREQGWWGWSHRAMYGFKIGHVAKEGDSHTTTGYIDGYIEEHPEDDLSIPVGFECKTLDDCKRCAIAFAESVG